MKNHEDHSSLDDIRRSLERKCKAALDHILGDAEDLPECEAIIRLAELHQHLCADRKLFNEKRGQHG